ncbi:MAG: hypothetical protein OEY99_08875 [Aigarchaeota archaeon]|nr:hypothetical protein [Aigarchaeota archaeon]
MWLSEHVDRAGTIFIRLLTELYAQTGLTVTKTSEKLLEAKYFLDRMTENQAERDAFKYNLGAFLSAARSVTLRMQSEFGNVPGFTDWYNVQRDRMKADDKMKILNAKRVATIHQESVDPHAHVHVSITEHMLVSDSVSVDVIRADGTEKRHYSTPPSPPPDPTETVSTVEWRWYFEEIPDMDVITVCKEHVSKLEYIVTECERLFSSRIDRD